MVNIKHVDDDGFDIRQHDVFQFLEDVSALVHRLVQFLHCQHYLCWLLNINTDLVLVLH